MMDEMAAAWFDEIQESDPSEDGALQENRVPCQGSPEAAKYLYVVARLEERIAEIRNVTEAQRDAVAQWEETAIAKLQRRISWLSFGLEGYIRAAGQKTISLPNGKLKLRVQQPKMVIDEEAFFRGAPPEPLVRLVQPVPAWRAPDNAAIRAHITKSGDIPEGITWEEPAQTKFSYSVVL